MRAVALALALASCTGSVVFVDPDADLKAGLAIVESTRLAIEGDPRTYLFVRLAGRRAIDRIELAVEGASGRTAIPMDAIEIQPCGAAASCLAITAGPGLLPDTPLSLVLSLPAIGHQATKPLISQSLTPYVVTADAHAKNTRLSGAIDDPIRHAFPTPETTTGTGGTTLGFLFPRRFEALVSAGPCAAPPDPADPAWKPLPEPRFELDAPFSDDADPLVCLSLRPDRPRAGPPVARVSVPARAVVTAFEHVYSPAVETAPLVFIPISDLELPTEARCVESEGLIVSAVTAAAQAIAASDPSRPEILAIPGERIATEGGVPCRQGNLRRFAATQVVAKINAALDQAFDPRRRVRVVVVYANNLDLPLPAQLIVDLQTLGRLLPAQGTRQLALLAIAPARVVDSLPNDAAVPYGASEEPAFRAAIMDALTRQLWPFRTQLHTSSTVVPLLPATDRGRFPLYRVCQGPPGLVPLGTPRQSVLEVQGEGPAYRIDLAPQVLLPPARFNLPSVRVEWQGCERLCDHASEGGDPRGAWMLEELRMIPVLLLATALAADPASEAAAAPAAPAPVPWALTGTSSIAPIPAPALARRVEQRSFTKESRVAVRGGFAYLSRGDLRLNPAVRVETTWYLSETLGLDLLSITGFFSSLDASADALRRSTGLLPDSQRPLVRLATGARYAFAYGKLLLEPFDSVVHLDASAALHLGALITDRGAPSMTLVTANVLGDAALVLQASLGPRAMIWIEAGWLISYEQRTTSSVASGPAAALGLGLLF